MRILTRYLLRAHLGPFLYALSVLTGLLLVNTIARRLEQLAGKGLPTSVIAEVFLLSIPHIVALTLPMAVLVAVLYAFSQLTAENEITALKASGVNLVRLLVPVLVAATFLAGVMIVFNDRILPETNHRLANLLVDIGRKSPTLQLREQVINEIRTGDMSSRYFLEADRIEPATNRLRGVVIYDLSTPQRGRTIFADSGRMEFNEARTDLYLTLFDGRIHELDEKDPRGFQRIFFGRYLLHMEGIGNELARSMEEGYRSDREMTLSMLWDEVVSRRQELAQVRGEARAQSAEALRAVLAGPAVDSLAARRLETAGLAPPGATPVAMDVPRPAIAERAGLPMRMPGARSRPRQPEDPVAIKAAIQLRSYERQVTVLQRQINRYEVEYHKKYAIPFACIVFVLIGGPLAVRFPRGGVGMVIAISLAIFGIYYIGLIGGEELADEGVVPPWVAMWAPNLIFLALSVWGLFRIGRESSTSRGGGWEDLREALRYFFRDPVHAITGRRSG